MTSAWTENGPVSLPPRSLAYGAGALLVALAIAGVALGLRAAWREAGAPDLGAPAASASGDDTLIAKPIVAPPPPVAEPEPTQEETPSDQAAADQTKADAIAAKTAAAQEIQAQPSKPAGDIDDILTSASEKPPAPAKAAPEEAPPGAPVKTDVPF